MQERTEEKPFKAQKRRVFLEKSFQMFTAANISSVTLQDIADASGYGIATLYRYFISKSNLVVETAVWGWKQYYKENLKRREQVAYEQMNGAQMLEFYLDSYLELYRNHKELLRFNQLFNIYIRSENIDEGVLKHYRDMIGRLEEQFASVYDKGTKDGTIRSDVGQSDMFCAIMHLMLAVVTRYAVGLAYKPEDKDYDEEKELLLLKEMLLKQYIAA